MPTVEEEVDKCIECGYCEPKCPSRELTLTPRQRIVVRREMTRLAAERRERRRSWRPSRPTSRTRPSTPAPWTASAPRRARWRIDTGQLTKRLRKAQPLAAGEEGRPRPRPPLRDDRAGDADGPPRRARRPALLGAGAMAGVTRAIRAVVRQPFPQWSAEMPRAAKAARPATTKDGAAAVYFPACISRTMGALPGEPDETSLDGGLRRGRRRGPGAPVWIPHDVEGTCCGVPFSSKGYDEAHAFTREPRDRALLGLVGRRGGCRSSSTRAPAPTA